MSEPGRQQREVSCLAVGPRLKVQLAGDPFAAAAAVAAPPAEVAVAAVVLGPPCDRGPRLLLVQRAGHGTVAFDAGLELEPVRLSVQVIQDDDGAVELGRRRGNRHGAGRPVGALPAEQRRPRLSRHPRPRPAIPAVSGRVRHRGQLLEHRVGRVENAELDQHVEHQAVVRRPVLSDGRAVPEIAVHHRLVGERLDADRRGCRGRTELDPDAADLEPPGVRRQRRRRVGLPSALPAVVAAAAGERRESAGTGVISHGRVRGHPRAAHPAAVAAVLRQSRDAGVADRYLAGAVAEHDATDMRTPVRQGDRRVTGDDRGRRWRRCRSSRLLPRHGVAASGAEVRRPPAAPKRAGEAVVRDHVLSHLPRQVAQQHERRGDLAEPRTPLPATATREQQPLAREAQRRLGAHRIAHEGRMTRNRSHCSDGQPTLRRRGPGDRRRGAGARAAVGRPRHRQDLRHTRARRHHRMALRDRHRLDPRAGRLRWPSRGDRRRRNVAVTFAPPAWARRLTDADRGLLFFDEISTAPPAVQAALLRVVLERTVGDLTLPRGVAIVAAANPPGAGRRRLGPVAAAGEPLLPPRLAADARRMAEGFTGGWGHPTVPTLPAGWEAATALARSWVPGFVTVRPPLAVAVPDDATARAARGPAPAAGRWRRGCWRLRRAARADQLAASLLVRGAVGNGAGVEFLTWLAEADLPDPEAVLADPGASRLPERGDRAYAALYSVAAAVRGEPHDRAVDRGWRVFGAGRDSGARTSAATAARTLASLPPGRRARPAGGDAFAPLLRDAQLLATRPARDQARPAQARRGTGLGGRPDPVPGQRAVRDARAGGRPSSARRGRPVAGVIRRPGPSSTGSSSLEVVTCCCTCSSTPSRSRCRADAPPSTRRRGGTAAPTRSSTTTSLTSMRCRRRRPTSPANLGCVDHRLAEEYYGSPAPGPRLGLRLRRRRAPAVRRRPGCARDPRQPNCCDPPPRPRSSGTRRHRARRLAALGRGRPTVAGRLAAGARRGGPAAVGAVAGMVDYSYRRPSRRAAGRSRDPADAPAPDPRLRCRRHLGLDGRRVARPCARGGRGRAQAGGATPGPRARRRHRRARGAPRHPRLEVLLAGGGGTDMGAASRPRRRSGRGLGGDRVHRRLDAWPAHPPRGIRVVVGLLEDDERRSRRTGVVSAGHHRGCFPGLSKASGRSDGRDRDDGQHRIRPK